MSGLGDLNVSSRSYRIGVLLIHRATLLEMRSLWNPDLRQ
jgi:hypothetical protein